MKAEIHPEYNRIEVKCSCGFTFETNSTLKTESGQLNVEVCSECHPFYTGQQKIVDTAGRVDSFKKRFGLDKKK